MSAASAMAREYRGASRRAFPRHSINVPLDVIILRSGIPDSLPGRCTDLSEVGVGAVIAGELSAGAHVALEFRLPNVAVPLRARALVRHHHQFRCGLQFVGLAADQREMIRYWAVREVPKTESDSAEGPGQAPAVPAPIATPVPNSEKHSDGSRSRSRLTYLLVLAFLALAAAALWQWQRGWHELEAPATVAAEQWHDAPLKVDAATMEKQIQYKVEPAYPEAARRAGAEGVVVLDAVIGADGTVERLRPLSGPSLLTQSALDAVQSWRFQPYRDNGKAVEVETTIAVAFQLN